MKCIECNNDTHNRVFCSLKCKQKSDNRKYKNISRGNNCKICNSLLTHKRVYCDTCWLNAKNNSKSNLDRTVCGICLILKTKENCSLIKNGKYNTYCKKCVSDIATVRYRNCKKLCVDYKGGKCEFCGYNKSLGALQFHHLDPSQKEFQISGKSNFNKKIMKELDKCILLCANCHFEIHYMNVNTNILVVEHVNGKFKL